MREILTILASLLIVALTAALVGPWFVDWTAQRNWVESELSRVSGARVRVAGAVDLKLLPVPRLEMSSIRVSGTRPEGPELDIKLMRVELAVGSLIRGELRFTEAVLEQPRLSLQRGEDGTVVLPRMPNFAPGGVQVERLSVTDGTLALRTAGGESPLVIGGLDLLGEAATLAGPFKGAGQLRVGTSATRYRFSTSTIEGDRIRLKALIDEGSLTPRGDFEGALIFTQTASGTRLSFEGQVGLSAQSQFAGSTAPWRLSGALKIDPSQAMLDPAEFRAGDDDRALAASGTAALTFGAEPRGRLTLTSRQLDLDRLFASPVGGGAAAAGARLAGFLGSALADGGLGARLPWPVTVSLSSPTAVLVGETFTEVRAELGLTSGGPVHIKTSATGPARSTFSLDGTVETGTAAAYRGRMELGSRDLPRFADWLALSAPDLAARLRDLPFRALDVAGSIDASAGGVIGRDLVVQADRSEFAGTIAFTRAMGTERARLFGDLTAEALDLDGLPELAGPARLVGDMDLSLSLDARAVRLARFGDGIVDAGRIGFKLLKEKETLRLERFSVADIGGASLSAEGGIEGGVAQLQGRLDAARLGDLADLVRRVAPGPLADALAARATALSPARLTLALRGKTGASGLQLEDLQVQGTARGTRIATQAQPLASGLDLSASFETADGPMLLRQIGVESLPLSGSGPGRLQIRAKGAADGGFETEVLGNVARSDVTFKGKVGGMPGLPEARGQVQLRSPDLVPLLRMLTFALPDIGATLVTTASADLSFDGQRLAIDKLDGTVAGVPVSGAISRSRLAENAPIVGGFRIEKLGLPVLASLALGPMGQPPRGALWPDGKFGPGLADVPPMVLALDIGRFDLGPTVGENARFTLRLSPGIVTMDEAEMRVGPGRIEGRLTIRRDGPVASLAGRIGLFDQPLPAGPATGSISGQFDITSTGQSFAALAGGLAGAGAAVMDDLVVANADLGGLSRLVDAADRGAVAIDESDLRRQLSQEFDRAPLRLGDRSFDVSIAAGVVRLNPRAEAGAPAQFSASFDLKNMTYGARLALVSPVQPKDWSGAAPSASLIWQGRAGDLRRTLDASPLINAISARAIAREAARVEALESDIRERAGFNRRLKAEEFMRRREREVQEFLEQQRKAEEQRQSEEARRAAEEEAQRKAAERRAGEDAARAADPIGRLLDTTPPDAAARAQAEREQAERERRRRAAEASRRKAEDSARAQQRSAPPVGLPPYPALEPLTSWPN
ncbi:MAG: hypothetical protein JWL93_389 [Hyphomicrobiales bacterium]|nr:hypothetical protein [Hyphomicrobiales bacterium]